MGDGCRQQFLFGEEHVGAPFDVGAYACSDWQIRANCLLAPHAGVAVRPWKELRWEMQRKSSVIPKIFFVIILNYLSDEEYSFWTYRPKINNVVETFGDKAKCMWTSKHIFICSELFIATWNLRIDFSVTRIQWYRQDLNGKSTWRMGCGKEGALHQKIC